MTSDATPQQSEGTNYDAFWALIGEDALAAWQDVSRDIQEK